MSAPVLNIEVIDARHSLLEQVETACVFPFVYAGVKHYSCITNASAPPPGAAVGFSAAWCGTDPTVTDETSWGTCTSHLVKAVGGTVDSSVSTSSDGEGNDFTPARPPAHCTFPFDAGGDRFYSCTRAQLYGDNEPVRSGELWCALTPDYDTDRKWGYCQIPTYGGTRPGTACQFPFWSRGVEYHGCTTDGGRGGDNRLWCATGPTEHLDQGGPAEWGYCSDGSETERTWGVGCSCTAGYTGHQCQRTCYGGTFGKGCLEDCTDCNKDPSSGAFVLGQCSSVTGECFVQQDQSGCMVLAFRPPHHGFCHPSIDPCMILA
jgi:hypothetical protein